MPSLDALDRLEKKGVKFAKYLGYDTNDTLASNKDLEMLMEVLDSVKDKNGNPAKVIKEIKERPNEEIIS